MSKSPRPPPLSFALLWSALVVAGHQKFGHPGDVQTPPRSLDTKSLKVYIRSASFVGKVPILVVYERLEVLINVTLMISTTGMVHQLPFHTNFFGQRSLTPLDKCPNFFRKKVLVRSLTSLPLFGQCPKFGSFF